MESPTESYQDMGVQFTAKFWRQFIKSIGSSQGLSLAFHLSMIRAAEKTNAMIEWECFFQLLFYE